jgi:hypothetical protein
VRRSGLVLDHTGAHGAACTCAMGSLREAVGGEFVLRLESVCKTAHDNAPPKHIGEEQHARAVGMMRRRVAPVWCR